MTYRRVMHCRLKSINKETLKGLTQLMTLYVYKGWIYSLLNTLFTNLINVTGTRYAQRSLGILLISFVLLCA